MGIRKIRDFETLEDLGWFYVFLKEETIRQQYEDLKTTPGSFFVVRDAENQIVSCDGRNVLEIQEAGKPAGSGLSLVRMGEQNYYYNELYMDETGWAIQEFTPGGGDDARYYRIRLMLASVIFLLLGILCCS